MPPRDKPSLVSAIAALADPAIVFLLDLFFLDKRGNATAKRDRLLALASGPARRVRLALHVMQAIDDISSFDISDADFEQLGDDNGVPAFAWFDDFIENVHDISPRFSKFPSRLFPDLARRYAWGAGLTVSHPSAGSS